MERVIQKLKNKEALNIAEIDKILIQDLSDDYLYLLLNQNLNSEQKYLLFSKILTPENTLKVKVLSSTQFELQEIINERGFSLGDVLSGIVSIHPLSSGFKLIPGKQLTLRASFSGNELKVLEQAMREEKSHVFFWNGIYSQWYKCEFTVDGNLFSSSEQYMMWAKATLFGDVETANKILASTNPRKIKELGREVKNFDASLWELNKFNFVIEGNFHKFSQNKDLKNALLSSEKTLVEAAPDDKIWGIGLHPTDDLVVNPENWLGTNLLGEALMKVRTLLRK